MPIYLSMLLNSSVEKLNNSSSVKSSLFRNTLFFTLGTSMTFFILGLSVITLSSFFNTSKDLIIIGGTIIIFMGLFYVDIVKLSLLNTEKRFQLKLKEINPITSFLLDYI
ncbi:cytochrome c biogenesis protein CcdA [Terrisporobacter othiniensis]|uniref:cytochrome c biogenesis protein CcdA n=1 Tax=Terrisporobacter othiniensis TaxID=1577792 RepID=UPI002FE6C7E0